MAELDLDLRQLSRAYPHSQTKPKGKAMMKRIFLLALLGLHSLHAEPVFNGDFSEGMKDWSLIVTKPACCHSRGGGRRPRGPASLEKSKCRVEATPQTASP